MPNEYRDAPIGESDIDSGIIDPASSTAAAPAAGTAGTGRRKKDGTPWRTRGSAGGAAKTQEKVRLDLSSLTGMFVGMHVMLAHATGRAEWAINDEEGKLFMDRAQAVMRHYSVQSTQKTLDWIAFGGTAMAIYGPRVVAVMNNRKHERAQNPGMGHNGGPAMEQPQQHHATFSVVPGPDEMAE